MFETLSEKLESSLIVIGRLTRKTNLESCAMIISAHLRKASIVLALV